MSPHSRTGPRIPFAAGTAGALSLSLSGRSSTHSSCRNECNFSQALPISRASTFCSASCTLTQSAQPSGGRVWNANSSAATARRSTIRAQRAPFLGRRLRVHGRPARRRSSPPSLAFPWCRIFVRLTWPPAAKARRWFRSSTTSLYRHRRYGRIVQNLGGIANLTAIPPRAQPEQVIAFDTGPGNMVIDAVTEHLFGKPYDRNGRLAARGEPIERVLRELLKHPFFRQKPPKTAGREQFGRDFVRGFLRLCRRADQHDIVATATALTARSIGIAVRKFVLPSGRSRPAASANCCLWRWEQECHPDANDSRRARAAEDSRSHQRRLRNAFRGEGSCSLRTVGVSDMATPAVECAFGNGRERPAILGKVSYA